MRIMIGGGGPRRSGGIPWWLIVGGLGFVIFGGWKGFFGAIAGVILIPIALLVFFALCFFVWSVFIAKKHGKSFQQRSPFEFERRQEEAQGTKNSTIIETEATVVHREDER